MHRLRRGIERFTVDLASEMATFGIEVHILTWCDPKNLQWPTAHPTIEWHQLPLTRYYQRFCAGFLYPRYIKKIKPDAILLSFLWHGEDKALHKIDPSIRTLFVLHSPATQISVRYEYVQQRQLVENVDQVVAVSNYVADSAYPYIGEVTAIIPNGVYTDYFRPNNDKSNARQSLNLPPKAKIIATVAALEERKGIQHLIAALPQVLKTHPDTHYLVAGEGSLREMLEAQIEAMQLSDNVHLLGNVADVRIVYDSADLFAFLSKGEAQGIAMIEAMASGLPLLLANQPPLDEFADHNGAIFVDETNSAEVACQTISLLNDQATRDAMGVHNRRVAVGKYDWSKVSKQYLALFETDTTNHVFANDAA